MSLYLLLYPQSALATPWTEGDKTLLYIRIDFSDLAGDPISTNDLKVVLSNVETYFRDNSYGALKIRSTSTPTLRMPNPEAFYEANQDQQQIIRDARDAAKNAGFDTALYDLDIVAFKTLGHGDSELAAIGAKGARILNNFRFGITIHAIGHNLGLPHSNFWKASDGSIMGAGESQEYGDWYDPMGGGGDEQTLRHHLVIRSKAILGWLGSNGLANVTTSGRYRIFAQDMQTDGPRGLHIVRDPQTEYWVEFRQLITDNPKMMNGIRILRSYSNRNAIDLLNMNPNSSGGVGDAPLVVGQTFSDLQAGIYITPIAINKTRPPSVDIIVNLGEFPQNPPISLKVSSNPEKIERGQSIEFNAIATDPNRTSLTYSWDFGDGEFDWGRAKTNHNWKESDRDYAVRAFVTDLKGRTANQLRMVTVGLPTTEHLTGMVSDLGKSLQGVRVNLSPADKRTTEMLQSISGKTQDTTVTDSDGRFVFVGLAKGDYTIRLYKPNYFILPVQFTCPAKAPLSFSAKRIGDAAPPPDRSRFCTLHIRATIDGTDVLRINQSEATWEHLGWGWPTKIMLNYIGMNPHNSLPNRERTRFLPDGVDINSAVLVAKTGRGIVDIWRKDEQLVINFDDPQPGAADYDVEIRFDSRSVPPR